VADATTKRFLIGITFAWAPWIPTIIGLAYAFRGISNATATGIAVVAGGLGEGFALWGVVAMVITEVAAIV
jgi:biopolymer transport protein ExbB/TolQ